MDELHNSYCTTWFRPALPFLFCLALLGLPAEANAACGLKEVALEPIRRADNPEALWQTLNWAGSSFRFQIASCAVCHLAVNGGPRNEFGNAVNTLLTKDDRWDWVRQREVGRRMADILANPLLPDSPSFGELSQHGRLPTSLLLNDKELPLREIPAKQSEPVTVERARELVKEIQAKSGWGILQLSRTHHLAPEVAAALAEFRGEMLILGLKSLTPEVAAALARSQAATVWLHSVTSVSPEAADAIVKLRGDLVLTGLAELDSVPLAEKLAARSGALSFPYLKEITPEIAAVLGKNDTSLTLAGLTGISPGLQDKLAETAGALCLPNLTSLDSMPLTKKLASEFLVLPKLQELTPEQARLLIQQRFKPDTMSDGMVFPLAVITPEVADVFANHSTPINLTLVGGGPISNEILATLLQSHVNLRLWDVEELAPGQPRIVRDILGVSKDGVLPLSLAKLSLPSLKRLDSPLLAEALFGYTESFAGVTSISDEAAAALGSLPERVLTRKDGTVWSRASYELVFPSLKELLPETARLLLKKRWVTISLPALQDVSVETLRNLVNRSYALTLGITKCPPEFAAEFEGFEANTSVLGGKVGGTISFPFVDDPSPEADRLRKAFGRGRRLSFGTEGSHAKPSLDVGLLDSPQAASKVLEEARYGAIDLRSLATLTPAAAEVLAASPYKLYLGLRGLDSPEVARALAKSQPGVKLRCLRAATPKVIEILKEAKSIETPPLETVYVLSEPNVRP